MRYINLRFTYLLTVHTDKMSPSTFCRQKVDGDILSV